MVLQNFYLYTALHRGLDIFLVHIKYLGMSAFNCYEHFSRGFDAWNQSWPQKREYQFDPMFIYEIFFESLIFSLHKFNATVLLYNGMYALRGR